MRATRHPRVRRIRATPHPRVRRIRATSPYSSGDPAGVRRFRRRRPGAGGTV